MSIVLRPGIDPKFLRLTKPGNPPTIVKLVGEEEQNDTQSCDKSRSNQGRTPAFAASSSGIFQILQDPISALQSVAPINGRSWLEGDDTVECFAVHVGAKSETQAAQARIDFVALSRPAQ